MLVPFDKHQLNWKTKLNTMKKKFKEKDGCVCLRSHCVKAFCVETLLCQRHLCLQMQKEQNYRDPNNPDLTEVINCMETHCCHNTETVNKKKVHLWCAWVDCVCADRFTKYLCRTKQKIEEEEE